MNGVVQGIGQIDENVGLCEYVKNIKVDKNGDNMVMVDSDYGGGKDRDGREID